LDHKDLHAVLKKAVESCIKINPDFANRFANLKSTEAVNKRKERDWLISLLDTWFAKRWNNKKYADLQKTLPPAKRKLDLGNCELCGSGMHIVCSNVDCHEEHMHQVFSSYLTSTARLLSLV